MKLEARTCSKCGASEDVLKHERCRICFKNFCAECASRMGGERFCSESCSMLFFHGEDDDEPDYKGDDYDYESDHK